MAGPIVRSGRVILGVELATPKINSAPVTGALAAAQKSAAVEIQGASAATAASTAALRTHAAAEADVAALVDDSTRAWRETAQEQRTQEKLAQALADAVDAEASSVANSGAASQAAAAKQNELNAANLKVTESYQKAALGALQMVRGVALLAGSENESIAAALKHVLAIQGLVDISGGAIKLQKSLAAAYELEAAAAVIAGAATTRAATAMAALNAVVKANPLLVFVAAVYATYQALDYMFGSTEKNTAAQEAHNKAVEKAVAIRESYNQRLANANEAELATIDHLDTAAQKQEALNKAMNAGGAHAEARGAISFAQSSGFGPEINEAMLNEASAGTAHQLALHEKSLAIAKEESDAGAKKIDDQIKLIELRERELTQAKDALKAEEDKSRAIRAQIGALNGGEQNQLKKLLDKANSGDLSRNEALRLQKIGGQAGQDIAEVFLAKMDKGLGDLAEKTRAKVTGEDPKAEAQAKFAEAERRRNDATGGKDGETAIKELQDAKQSLVDTFEDMKEEMNALMRAMIADQLDMRQEIEKQKAGAIRRNAT